MAIKLTAITKKELSILATSFEQSKESACFQKKISIAELKRKSEVLHKELVNYQITFQAFSLEEM